MRGEIALKERIAGMAESVLERLDLGWLTIIHQFDPQVSNEGTLADTVTHWQYREATITWNLPGSLLLDDEELLVTLVHEIVHTLLAPLWNEIPQKHHARLTKLNELSTENIARALLSALAE